MQSILVVEDEVLIAEDIKECLQRYGYEVPAIVTSGEDAIEFAGTKKVDAVLMDIHLRGSIDGISAAEQIYSQYHIPCLFLTAFAEPALLERAKSAGSFGYLLKPFDDFQLLAMLEMVLAKSASDAEKALLEKRLSQAVKLEAIGTLAGGIAHDFNNILAIIMGYAEMVKEDMTKAGLKTSKVQQIIKASDRAKNIVQQILTFSHMSNLQIEPLDMDALLSEAVVLLRASIPAMIKIEYKKKGETGTVLADRSQILQIVMNLCINAAQAMSGNEGAISMTLERVGPSAKLTRTELNNVLPSYLLLVVSDNGSGIEKSILPKIFDPYFTTKEIGAGSGLGLSVVQGIVHRLRGDISVESVPGTGTTFSIYLPEAEKIGKVLKAECKTVLAGSESILLVDDEKLIAEMAEEMLTRGGYRVTVVGSAEEALALFKVKPETFDVVITDHAMPGMTGVLLAKKLLDIRPDLPIILCSGDMSMYEPEDLVRAGFRGILSKPYLRGEISEIVRRVLDKVNRL
nr:response regulator [Desulfobulbaceae bacterium]